MAEYYAPATKKIALPSGRTFQLRKGIHNLPAELVDDPSANTLGIKPVEEMTDGEWQALALDKAAWMKAHRPVDAAPAKPVGPVATPPAPQVMPPAPVPVPSAPKAP